MIYKMRGWNWNMTNKRPGVVGQWINNIVYERIAPLTLSTLMIKILKMRKDIERINITNFLQKILGSLS